MNKLKTYIKKELNIKNTKFVNFICLLNETLYKKRKIDNLFEISKILTKSPFNKLQERIFYLLDKIKEKEDLLFILFTTIINIVNKKSEGKNIAFLFFTINTLLLEFENKNKFYKVFSDFIKVIKSTNKPIFEYIIKPSINFLKDKHNEFFKLYSKVKL